MPINFSVLLHLTPHKKTGKTSSKSTENILARLNTELDAELNELKQQKECLVQERSSLLDSLKRTNEEFILLKKKRIQDVSISRVKMKWSCLKKTSKYFKQFFEEISFLYFCLLILLAFQLHTLQLAHEKELMQMNMQICPLQEEIKILNRSVEILQERVKNSEDKLLRYQAGIRDLDIHAGGDNPRIRSGNPKKRGMAVEHGNM